MNHLSLDLSTFRPFPPQRSIHAVPRLSINEKGDLAMNAAFRKQVGTTRDFRGLYAENGNQLILIPGEKPNIHFSNASGTAKNQALAEILKGLGYRFPILYRFTWSEADKAWVGSSQEMSPPPEIAVPVKPRRKRQRKEAL